MRKADDACNGVKKQVEERDYTVVLRGHRVKEIWIYGIVLCDYK